jgi:hypothetical protein
MSMRARRIASIVGVVVMLSAFGPVTSLAHPTTSFEACAAYKLTSQTCLDNASYLFGETVYLRAKVAPAHAGSMAAVLRRDPGSNVWMRVAAVRVSDYGKMRFEWTTSRDDADQQDPYLFRFKITGHGRSNKVRTWVLLGE